MSDAWDFYFAQVNDALSSLFVDLGVSADAPVAAQPWLAWVWLEMKAPRPDGLSSSEESAALGEIEDVLVPKVIDELHAAFVGRITGSGRREFFFYTPSAEGFEACVNAALASFPEYRFSFGQREDREWKLYSDLLCPGPTDLLRIQNRHVVEKLAEQGDQASSSRRIDHWAYFPTPDARAAFAAAIGEHAFLVVGEMLKEEAGAELPHCLQFMREDPADWHSVNDVTELLTTLAEELEGDYDGWECPVTKPGDAAAKTEN
jgi:regulator of RNase E activity RraB